MPRPRRTSTRAAKAKRANLAGYIVLAVLALAGVGGTIVFFQQKAKVRILDQATYCPADGADSVTVVLVDMTDEITQAQRQDFHNQFAGLRESVPRYGEIDIYAVDSVGQTLLKPLVTLCNPGRGSDIDPIVGNPMRVEKRWREGFEGPLEQAFATITQSQEAARSPIFESIQSAALTQLLPPQNVKKPRRLIVVSDLIQFTSDINFYRPLPKADEFVRSSPFLTIRTDLRGVEVELWMLRRANQAKVQTRQLIDLWEAAIRAQGGSLTRVYNVSG